MKTSRTSTKSKEASRTKKSEKSSEAEGVETLPSEHQIREKAEEIYFQRVERGEHRNADEDWYEAEALLRYSEQKAQ